MRAFSLLIGLGLTNAVDLPQDIIGEERVIFIRIRSPSPDTVQVVS